MECAIPERTGRVECTADHRVACRRRLPGVSRAVRLAVHLVGADQLEPEAAPLGGDAVAVAERTIVAGSRVPAGAGVLADRVANVVIESVLPGRPDRVHAKAQDLGRLVPDGVGQAGVELGPVVASGIAHDAVVVAWRIGEEVEVRRHRLVRRVVLAQLQGSERRADADIAVARGEGASHRGVCWIDRVVASVRLAARGSGDVDLRF